MVATVAGWLGGGLWGWYWAGANSSCSTQNGSAPPPSAPSLTRRPPPVAALLQRRTAELRPFRGATHPRAPRFQGVCQYFRFHEPGSCRHEQFCNYAHCMERPMR